MKNILFRADSSSDVGLGHIIRNMVLTKAYEKEGDKISFASRNLEDNIIDKVHYKTYILKSNIVEELN